MRLVPVALLVACTGAAGPADSDEPVDSDPPDTDVAPHGCAETSVVEGAPIAQEGSLTGTRDSCTSVVHAGAGAGGSTLQLRVDGWSGDLAARVRVTDVRGRLLLPLNVVETGSSAEFTLATSGEFLVELQSADIAADPTDYEIGLSCASGCDRGYTRYPIVMVHGLGGGDVVGGVDYFYNVRDDLEARGYVVYNPAVPAFADSADRGEALAADLDAILAETGARKVNLIGHSQGGLDSRFAVSSLGYGDRVAAIITVGSPHHGTPVADVLTGAYQINGIDTEMIDLGAQVFASLYGLEGDSASITASLEFLTTETAADFDAANPDDERVYYASWGGHTCGTLEPDCQDERGGEVVDPLFETLYLINWAAGVDSDGLVPVESAHHGEWMGEINADHADEIGQFQDEGNAAFDHLAFYESEAARLRSLGF